MHLTFRGLIQGHEQVRSLFQKHVKEGEPLTAEALITIAKLRNAASLKGTAYQGQAILIRCQLDKVMSGGMLIDPLSMLHSRGEKLSDLESANFVKEVRARVAEVSKGKRVNVSIRDLMPLDCVKDGLYAVKLIYSLMVMGSGEIYDKKSPALPN